MYIFAQPATGHRRIYNDLKDRSIKELGSFAFIVRNPFVIPRSASVYVPHSESGEMSRGGETVYFFEGKPYYNYYELPLEAQKRSDFIEVNVPSPQNRFAHDSSIRNAGEYGRINVENNGPTYHASFSNFREVTLPHSEANPMVIENHNGYITAKRMAQHLGNYVDVYLIRKNYSGLPEQSAEHYINLRNGELLNTQGYHTQVQAYQEANQNKNLRNEARKLGFSSFSNYQLQLSEDLWFPSHNEKPIGTGAQAESRRPLYMKDGKIFNNLYQLDQAYPDGSEPYIKLSLNSNMDRTQFNTGETIDFRSLSSSEASQNILVSDSGIQIEAFPSTMKLTEFNQQLKGRAALFTPTSRGDGTYLSLRDGKIVTANDIKTSSVIRSYEFEDQVMAFAQRCHSN